MLAKLVPTFADRGVAWSAQRIPTAVNFGFLDRHVIIMKLKIMKVINRKWREAANILNKQSQTADKGWSSSLGVGHGANN
jgi:hypothetical protein